MTTNYREELARLIAELHANPAIQVTNASLAAGADPARLAAFAEGMRRRGLVVPQELLDLYGQVNGFTLQWEPRAGTTVADDRLYLYPAGRKPWTLPPCYTELRPFEGLVDAHDQVGWDLCDRAGEVTAGVHFLVDHDQEEQGVWLVAMDGAPRLFRVYDQGEGVDLLDGGVDELFRQFIASRGFFCWPSLVTPSTDQTETYDRWSPVLFPST
jgi:hypothetical protein